MERGRRDHPRSSGGTYNSCQEVIAGTGRAARDRQLDVLGGLSGRRYGFGGGDCRHNRLKLGRGGAMVWGEFVIGTIVLALIGIVILVARVSERIVRAGETSLDP